MNPTDLATKAVEANQHDPVISGLLYLLGAIIILVTVSTPIMNLVRNYKKNGAENSKSDAESELFERLQQQLITLSGEVEKLKIERNVWFEKAFHLEAEVTRLSNFEKMFESMKGRLDEKDRTISERDDEIRTLMRSVLEMKDRIHLLEMRLSRDEQYLCADRKFRDPIERRQAQVQANLFDVEGTKANGNVADKGHSTP